MKLVLQLLFICFTYSSFSQVGIGTTAPDPSSILDVTSTTGGFLPPRMTEIQRDNITSPAEGLFVYNLDDNCYQFYNGTTWSQCLGQVQTNKLDCTSVVTNGINITSNPLTINNSITIDVVVNTLDTYVINTNTVNGYSYSAAGAFGSIGINTITLYGTGTPLLQQTDTFTIDFVGTGFTCMANISVINQPYANCLEYLTNGFNTSGTYTIDPDGSGGNSPYNCYCDMTNNGGGWTLVFNHDISGGYWASDIEADSHNITSPGISTNKYSILNKIDELKSAADYEFRLHYPTSNRTNHWKQTFDPRSGGSSSNPVTGYTAISIDMTGNSWGGLEKSGNSTFLDGSVSVGSWWYSIGSNSVYASTGVPAGNSTVEDRVQLFIR